MKGFVVAISIKERERGSRYSVPVLDTGYMDVHTACDEANRVLEHKFGVPDRLEMTRSHRRKRRD